MGGERPSEVMNSGAVTDLLTVEDLGRRMRMSPKTLKQLGREEELPLFRITPHGPIFAFWPEVERWLRQHRALLSTGKIQP